MKWNINKLPARTKDWILTGMFAMIICLLPLIFSSDYVIHIGCMIGINILLALGMHFVTGLAGQINIANMDFTA